MGSQPAGALGYGVLGTGASSAALVCEAGWLLEERCQAWAAGPASVKPCQSACCSSWGFHLLPLCLYSPGLPLLQSPQAHQRLIFHAGGPAGEALGQGQVGGGGGGEAGMPASEPGESAGLRPVTELKIVLPLTYRPGSVYGSKYKQTHTHTRNTQLENLPSTKSRQTNTNQR